MFQFRNGLKQRPSYRCCTCCNLNPHEGTVQALCSYPTYVFMFESKHVITFLGSFLFGVSIPVRRQSNCLSHDRCAWYRRNETVITDTASLLDILLPQHFWLAGALRDSLPSEAKSSSL